MYWPADWLLGMKFHALFLFYWVMQTILLIAQMAIVVEICRRAMGSYPVIWRLCRSVLTVISFVLLGAVAYQCSDSAPGIAAVVLAAERGSELAIVGILLFTLAYCRYCHIKVESPINWIAVGIGLYSAVRAANNSVLQNWLLGYFHAWSSIRLLSFQIVTALWCALLWKSLPAPRTAPALLERRVYDELLPEVSRQLRKMNSELVEMLK